MRRPGRMPMEKELLLSVDVTEGEVLECRRPMMLLRDAKGEVAAAKAEKLEGVGGFCSLVSL